jgi:lysophospholipase L1-like esterase
MDMATRKQTHAPPYGALLHASRHRSQRSPCARMRLRHCDPSEADRGVAVLGPTHLYSMGSNHLPASGLLATGASVRALKTRKVRYLHMNLQNLRRPRNLPTGSIVLSLMPLMIFVAGCQTVPIPDPAVRYIAFGDSTTAGPADRQYWEFLRDDLAAPGDSFASQGQGGESTADGLARLRSILDSNLYPNAQTLLYWEGGNDVLVFVRDHDPLLILSPEAADYPYKAEWTAALDTTQANIEQAIRMGRQAGLTVYVATYFDMTEQVGACKPALLHVLLPGQAELVNQYVRSLNGVIRQAAAAEGAILVDVAAQAATIAADPGNYANCDHLSAQGNRIVAGIFRQAITPAGSP